MWCFGATVDGSEIRLYNQLRLVVYPTIYKVLAPSQVVQDFFHQQYVYLRFATVWWLEKNQPKIYSYQRVKNGDEYYGRVKKYLKQIRGVLGIC